MKKKVDWDFRLIMGVFTLSALFGAWLFTEGYPAEWQAVKDAVVWPFRRLGEAIGEPWVIIVVLASLLIVIGSVIELRSRRNGSRPRI